MINKLLQLQQTNKIKYNDFYFRITAAVISALLIVCQGQWFQLPHLVTHPNFPLVTCISILIALFVIEWSYWFTLWLDKKYPWEKNNETRTLYQGILCGVVPLILSTTLASFWYAANGVSIWKTRHMSEYFGMEAAGFIILSFIYYARYQAKFKKLPIELKFEAEPDVPVIIYRMVAYLKKIDNLKYEVYFDNGDLDTWNCSWDECMRRLPADHYFYYDERYMIRYNNVLCYDDDISRRLFIRTKFPKLRALKVKQRGSTIISKIIKFKRIKVDKRPIDRNDPNLTIDE